MMSRWRGRLATSSSMTGKTAARPRSMRLCPPILTTLASGRIWNRTASPVPASSSSSLREPVTSLAPRSVSSASPVSSASLMSLLACRGSPRAGGSWSDRREPDALQEVSGGGGDGPGRLGVARPAGQRREDRVGDLPGRVDAAEGRLPPPPVDDLTGGDGLGPRGGHPHRQRLGPLVDRQRQQPVRPAAGGAWPQPLFGQQLP